MKKLLGLFLIGLLLVSCKEEVKKTEGYVINGTAKGIYNGVRVYLNASDINGRRSIPIGSAMVMDEKFVFEGKTDTPQMWYLEVDGVNGFIPVMVENSAINIVFDKTDINASKVTGTRSNEVMKIYNDAVEKMMAERNEINLKVRTHTDPADSLARKEIISEFNKINERLTNYPFEFAANHKDATFSLVMIEKQLLSPKSDINKIEESFENLNTEIKNSQFGQIVKSKILTTKASKENLAKLDIGQSPPEFSGPSPDGKTIALSDIKGKATIIDFWASWCGPCRKENPNVVKVYEKYHKKGLEIIGVSLDRAGQKDKWVKAIADDKLTWHHISNLNYFNDPIAQQYNIRSIPATFILDSNGKIVAKNLRGKALEDKIAELLD